MSVLTQASGILSHAAENPPAAAANAPAEEVTRFFQHNKVPLLAIAERAPAWLAEAPAFQSAVAAERAWYETQRREYGLVRDAWLERGVPCLMIKSAGNFPSFPYTSDNIDVLVRPAHGRLARDVLRRLGYVEIRNVEEPGKFLFRKFHDGRCVSAIHVHEQVAWFVGFMDEDALWARIRPAADDAQVNVPSPEDVILINLAHACYENKLLRLNDVLRVRHALSAVRGKLDWRYMERVAAARGWSDGLCYLLLVYAQVEEVLFGTTLLPRALQAQLEQVVRRSPAAWKRLERLRSGVIGDLPLDLSYWFCKRLYYRKILADPTRSATGRWRDAFLTLVWGIRLKSRVRPQPGMVVSLSGPDGSGKTAHAAALADALRLCELKVDYVWSRGGSTGLAALAGRVRRALGPRDGVSSGTATADSITRRRQRLANPLVRFVWAWMVAADQIATAWWRVWLPARLGRIVVADRYAYDTAVEMDASLPNDAVWSRRAIDVMVRLTPRPDLPYLLRVSPEAARARKPEECWHAGLERERRAYGALAARFSMETLSTDGAFAYSNDALVRDVVTAFMSGYETWLNALFFYNPSQKNRPDPVWLATPRLEAAR